MIWQNLLDNALKYSAKEEVSKISSSYKEEEHWQVLTLKDNGVGFLEEEQAKAFGLFQRLHSSEEFEGSGVGLAIVKRSLDRLEGKVTVQSEVGEGSTFTVMLPRSE